MANDPPTPRRGERSAARLGRRTLASSTLSTSRERLASGYWGEAAVLGVNSGNLHSPA